MVDNKSEQIEWKNYWINIIISLTISIIYWGLSGIITDLTIFMIHGILLYSTLILYGTLDELLSIHKETSHVVGCLSN